MVGQYKIFAKGLEAMASGWSDTGKIAACESQVGKEDRAVPDREFKTLDLARASGRIVEGDRTVHENCLAEVTGNVFSKGRTRAAAFS